MERLNYQQTHKIPQIFTESEINAILNQISKCQDYWKKKEKKKDFINVVLFQALHKVTNSQNPAQYSNLLAQYSKGV